MSAIAGILHFNGAVVEPGTIETLTEAMSARGPDGRTHWVEGAVALGHGMLRTTPESLDEHQPLKSSDGTLVLVWDGRLDNRADLRRALVADGAILRDNTDAELALQCYSAWGEDCPTRMLGDFAFAVWDSRRRCFFCARDHMGARPFYYARNEHFFAFASEEEALPRLPGVSSRPNEELIAYFFVQSFVSFERWRSWLRDVLILPPATRVTVSVDGNWRAEAYWTLEPSDELVFRSDEDCREAFLEVFGEAVRCRLRSSGQVAAMMSGGLDSASIAAMVRRLRPELSGKEFLTYSAISDDPETCIESQCIRDLTFDLGDRAHFVSVPSFTGMLSVSDLIEVGWSRPHPCDNSILLPAAMCLAASRNAQRVMLHGVSGDLTLRTRDRYAAHYLRAGRLRTAWRECVMASQHNTYLHGTSPASLFAQNAWTAYAPPALKRLRRALKPHGEPSGLATSLIDRRFAERLGLARTMRTAERGDPAWSPDAWQRDQVRALLAPHGITDGLGAYDKVAGRHGIELRDPWADKRVVEFFLRLPVEHRVRNGWTKYLVRTAFEADLSARVRNRIGKEHVGWHFANRLMTETRQLVVQAVEHGLDRLQPYVDLPAVQQLCARYVEGNAVADCERLHDVVTAALWLDRLAALPQATRVA